MKPSTQDMHARLVFYYTPGRGKIVPRNVNNYYTPGRGKIVPRNVM